MFICIGIPLITSYCLCLSSQCPLSSPEPWLHPIPWPTVAAFPFIIWSPRSPWHAALWHPALLKALVQLTPLLCALPLIFINFHCSAAQFPLILSSAVQWLSAAHQPDVVSNAAYRSSSNILLFLKCSVISPSHFSLPTVIWRPPVSSCVLQVHVLSNKTLQQACWGWDCLVCVLAQSDESIFYKYHYPSGNMLEGNRFLCFPWHTFKEWSYGGLQIEGHIFLAIHYKCSSLSELFYLTKRLTYFS